MQSLIRKFIFLFFCACVCVCFICLCVGSGWEFGNLKHLKKIHETKQTNKNHKRNNNNNNNIIKYINNNNKNDKWKWFVLIIEISALMHLQSIFRKSGDVLFITYATGTDKIRIQNDHYYCLLLFKNSQFFIFTITRNQTNK